ncbi:sensor histidine kinase [Rhizorhabdus histidinilytica]|uniref:sensor histidine kinase n=1 Tax=Rhizorhabdus histidinilytica TaxID=439228 RepID=UPI0032200490
MRRFPPRSLAAQMLLLLGVALLVAQLVNFALILNERQKLSLAQNEGPAITRYAQVASDMSTALPDLRDALLSDMSRRGERFALQADAGVAEALRQGEIEKKLSAALAGQGIAPRALRAAFAEETRSHGPPRRRLVLATRQDDGRWLVGRMPVPPRDEWLAARLAAATLLVYVIVLGASGWIALRLARPLRDLTRAANAFGGRDEPMMVTPAGPDDLRQAIAAFNAMNRRVVALLDDKDRMLGALGHDLRTPLASLRIRVESMEPPEERDAAVAKIGEMADMLEEILMLARAGRARERARPMDVTALVEMLVDEQRELGRAARMATEQRVVAPVQPGPLRRAVANLIDNAITYGGSASASVASVPGGVEIRIADEGPGLAEEELERVFEPFYRVEGSRSRETGGAGLGLAIARSIAESHGGTLTLERADRERGGLVAILTLPL